LQAEHESNAAQTSAMHTPTVAGAVAGCFASIRGDVFEIIGMQWPLSTRRAGVAALLSR